MIRVVLQSSVDMELYLIRHGLAGQHGDYPDDDQRPLTPEGERKTEQVAKRMRSLDLKFDLILTSPLTRAKQTAKILQKAGLSDALETAGYLAPGGDIQNWHAWVESWRSPDKALALVGHEPDLSSWAELLIWGEVRDRFILKKAGVIGLELPESGSALSNSQLFWLTPPRLFL
ncbi:phosphohistidine phosphatase SixA [Leptolyngbya boryana NIES-2135]|jgi:phosphohistidine phosphatase|uniref:Phosphohistidine phosphatase SixA n=2 Tax=Leptolyngbya group TaxID=3081713 RepID=A0A1Z4JEJ0_LEPBY|nr:phosphohistidine phosphatase, SixA [Leptolyngbya boryana IAM M-101]BAS64864.1 phosphohistidine phosphatase, SixA [Leptolyngbya boryana dg5]BAY55156.1 phosphohistidine phosphatase SixA [Leptolyngbya boryana NIES-2135]